MLLLVGMTTPDATLLIVINLGMGMIVFVDYYPYGMIIVKKQVTPQRQTATSTPAAGITNQTTAAIVSAVSVMTGGKGKVVKIEKL